MRTVADLAERLQALHARTAETPLFNPVFQLSLDLSRLIESGELTLSDCETLIGELECDALKSRAGRLRRLVAPVRPEANRGALEIALTEADFESFRARWERPQLHAVFTAHPTFLLTPSQSNAVAQAASIDSPVDGGVCVVAAERPAITLAYEHDQAMHALAHAQDARDTIVSRVLAHAQREWPDRWSELQPLPFRFATWVGYDMDGRTDIGWAQSIGFRLAEKAERLARYVASLEAIDRGHSLLGELRAAAAYAADRARDFAADLGEPAALSAAANRLTADDPGKHLARAR